MTKRKRIRRSANFFNETAHRWDDLKRTTRLSDSALLDQLVESANVANPAERVAAHTDEAIKVLAEGMTTEHTDDLEQLRIALRTAIRLMLAKRLTPLELRDRILNGGDRT